MSILSNLNKLLSILQSVFFNPHYATGKLPAQSKLQQRYTIIENVGTGGMGAVYLALDTAFLPHVWSRRIAIKEMSQAKLDATELDAAIDRFQREASLLHSLQHPNLPHVYNWFQEQGRSYLVMDFIEGESLLQMINKASGYRFPVEQVLHYALQLCDVLQYLHTRQPQPIIFRDLKLSNVMVDENAKVFLIDFGIARFFKGGRQRGDTEIIGTEGYAPPEQYSNSQEETDPRSDLYSLGATLHCCLTGRDPRLQPFMFPPVHQFNPLPPPELDQLIQDLVAIDRTKRPFSAAEVKQRLTRIDYRWRMSGMYQHQGTLSVGKHPFGSTPNIHGDATILPPTLPPTILSPAPGNSHPSQKPLPLTTQPSGSVPSSSNAGTISSPQQGTILSPLPASPGYSYPGQGPLHLGPQSSGASSSFYDAGTFQSPPPGSRPQASGNSRPGQGPLHLGPQSSGASSSFYDAQTPPPGPQKNSASPPPTPGWVKLPGQGLSWVATTVPKVIQGIGSGFTILYQTLSKVRSWRDFQKVVGSWFSPTWSGSFIALLMLLLIVTIGGSILAINVFHISYHVIGLGLLLVLLLVGIVRGRGIRDFIPRNVLISTEGIAVVSCLFLLATPDIQEGLHSFTFNQLLVGGLVVIGVTTLIRTENRLAWVDHIAVFGIAGVCTLLQYSFGERELLLPSDGQPITTYIIAGLLGVLALVSLARSFNRFNTFDRSVVLVAVLVYAWLQLSLGYRETQLLSSGHTSVSNLLNMISLNLLLVGGPVVAALIALVGGHWFSWLSRAMIFTIASACAWFQASIGNQEAIPLLASNVHPLATKVLDVVTPNQLITVGLIIGFLIVLVRLLLLRLFTWNWVDRITVFSIALGCAWLQFASEQLAAQHVNVPVSNVQQLYWIVINQNIALGLIGIVLLVSLIAAIVWLLQLTRQFNRVDLMMKKLASRLSSIKVLLGGVDRLTVLWIALTCLLLQVFFGNISQILAFSFDLPATTSSSGQLMPVTVTVSQIFIFVLVVSLLVPPTWIWRPLKLQVRVIILIGTLASILLSWGNDEIQRLPLISSSMQQLLKADVVTLNRLVASSLVLAAIILLFWLSRASRAKDRKILGVVLSGAIITALIQAVLGIGEPLLLVPQIVLIQGVLIATQIEYVQHPVPQKKKP